MIYSLTACPRGSTSSGGGWSGDRVEFQFETGPGLVLRADLSSNLVHIDGEIADLINTQIREVREQRLVGAHALDDMGPTLRLTLVSDFGEVSFVFEGTRLSSNIVSWSET